MAVLKVFSNQQGEPAQVVEVKAALNDLPGRLDAFTRGRQLLEVEGAVGIEFPIGCSLADWIGIREYLRRLGFQTGE